jgi:DNA sulfur modification protein DndB
MSTKRRTSIAAFKVEGGSGHFYVAVMSGKKLFDISEVSRAKDDGEKGYQRHLSQSRAKKIAAYLDEGYLIPGSIIVSAQETARFQYDENKNMIRFAEENEAFLVIDGQHRLYGAHYAEEDTEFVVTIFDDIGLEGEVKYFLDVNGNQRGVPKTLQLEILKFSVPEESQDDIRIKLFKALSSDVMSPLCGKMSATQSAAGKITHVPFKAAIDPLFKIDLFAKATTDQKEKLLMNFLNAAVEVLSEVDRENMISNSAFFRALFSAFRQVVSMTKLQYGDLKEESFVQVMQPLKHIDWDSHKGTNNSAITEFGAHIASLVEETEISDSLL